MVFEHDLSERLDVAVAKVLRKTEEADFLFYQKGTFYDLCMAAVLKAQRRYPQKQIRIVLIRDYKDNDEADKYIPMCLIDATLKAPQFPPSKSEHNHTLNYRRTVRWIIAQCSYLISYMYPQIQSDETQFYRFAKQKKLTILDVTDRETADYLEEQLNHRSERVQIIIKGRQAGRSLREIGMDVGVSESRVQQNIQASSRALTRSAATHLREQPKALISCSIFTLGTVTPEKIGIFRRVVSFLITHYQVAEFKITAETSYSDYMKILRREIAHHLDIRLSIITHYAEDTPEKSLHEKQSRYRGLCDSVENVNPYTKRTPRAKMLQTIRWMMGNTDYCICCLPDNPLRKSIENHARKLGGVRLFDIGQNTHMRVCGDK